LSGFTVSGVSSTEACNLDDPQYGIHIQAPATGVKVSGGTVTGFVDGIVLYSSSSRAYAMTVTDNCAFGIVVSGTKNVVDTNLVSGSGIDGVGLVEASAVTVEANYLFDNSRYGVVISAFSDGNTVQSNIMKGNGVAVGAGGGILIANGNSNLVQDNAAIGNFDGISLGESITGSIVRRNTANGNVSVGIAVGGGSTPNSITGNTARGNGAVDLSDSNPGCGANIWKNKLFATDSVAAVSDGGPTAGCIR
jgi:parallel beta-helix repeat protein